MMILYNLFYPVDNETKKNRFSDKNYLRGDKE